MKIRITSNENHPLGNKFKTLYQDVDFYSRSNGFDIHGDITSFLTDTVNYDLTVNLSRAMSFGQVKLLTQLDKYTHEHKIHHVVLNIGSYVNTLLLNSPHSSYDIEKASVKYAHKKIAFAHMFHNNYLDSRLINLGHLDEISVDIHDNYKHLNTMALTDVMDNIEFMLGRPNIKELSVQYKQPGNHRINDGVGLILPGIY